VVKFVDNERIQPVDPWSLLWSSTRGSFCEHLLSFCEHLLGFSWLRRVARYHVVTIVTDLQNSFAFFPPAWQLHDRRRCRPSKMFGERLDGSCVQSFLLVRFVVINHPLNNSNASLLNCDCGRTLSLSQSTRIVGELFANDDVVIVRNNYHVIGCAIWVQWFGWLLFVISSLTLTSKCTNNGRRGKHRQTDCSTLYIPWRLRVRRCKHGEENAFRARRSWGSNRGMGLSLKKKCSKIFFSLTLKEEFRKLH